mmetsp:Transcript_136865/g.437877  ORF Transcript_136865/g.437877 Transcript_136865/m.437877 type:complete len:289 (-) Transcript_136865:107-973(-)
MSGASPGMMLIKVPRWLSEEWLKAPPEAEVADLDLESGKMHLLAHAGKGRPANLLISRRASPELFAFPVCGENEEVQVEGGIVEALSVATDLNDDSYKTMIKERLESNSSASAHRSVLEEKIIPLSRSCFLAREAGRRAGGEEFAEEEADSRRTIWNAIQQGLKESPDGITCEDLLVLLPRAPSFLEVRNALSHMAEPLEVDGSRRFVTRRRTAAEAKVEMKTEAQAALAAKLEMKAKREHQAKLEQKAKEEQRAKLEKDAKKEEAPADVKREPPSTASAPSAKRQRI